MQREGGVDGVPHAGQRRHDALRAGGRQPLPAAANDELKQLVLGSRSGTAVTRSLLANVQELYNQLVSLKRLRGVLFQDEAMAIKADDAMSLAWKRNRAMNKEKKEADKKAARAAAKERALKAQAERQAKKAEKEGPYLMCPSPGA